MKKFLIIVFGLILVVALLVVIGYLLMPDYYKVLVIGSDQREMERSRSDVLMVIAVPKSSKNFMNIIMVPRDTKIEHKEWGMQKITHLYFLGERTDSEVLGNLDATQETVEDLLDIKMDATVEVTFESFIEIVDKLGGVDVGGEHVDGADAKEMVHNRFVQETGDFGRAENQREILRNLVTRAKSYENAKMVMDYFDTSEKARLRFNKTKAVMFGAAFFIGHRGRLSLGEMHEEILPGSNGRIYTPDFGKELYYWILDEEGVKEMVDEYLK
ncbi:MAG: LCP family protein [Patescibacteria group bacterium]